VGFQTNRDLKLDSLKGMLMVLVVYGDIPFGMDIAIYLFILVYIIKRIYENQNIIENFNIPLSLIGIYSFPIFLLHLMILYRLPKLIQVKSFGLNT